MPNWNSWTMPVTTPMAKLMRKSFPKNLVVRQVLVLAGAVPGRLQAGDEDGESDRERDEEEVVDGRDAELPPSKV